MTPPKSKVVCECLKVTESQLLKAIDARKMRDLKDIICYTSAGDGCTACHPLLAEYLEKRRAAEDPATSSLRPSSARPGSSQAPQI